MCTVTESCMAMAGQPQARREGEPRTSDTSLTRCTVMASRTSSGRSLEAGAVAGGEDHLGQSGTVSRQHLLLQSADREHATLQRDLAGHADLGAHRRLGEQRDEGTPS
jgi:hypothetical protein